MEWWTNMQRADSFIFMGPTETAKFCYSDHGGPSDGTPSDHTFINYPGDR